MPGDLYSTERAPAPWYRQFWPWFLIVLPGSVVVAAIATLIIAVRGSDDLVADDYYKDGLAINRELAREERAAEAGYRAEVTLLADRVAVVTDTLPPQASLRLQLSHPMEADRDMQLELRRSEAQRYEAALPQPPGDGSWHWRLDAGADSDWRLSGAVTVTPDGPQRAE
jgi:hypothetical protein